MERNETDPLEIDRRRLVDEVEDEFRRTRKWTGRSRPSAQVLNAMLRVPRHEFVPADLAVSAYVNRPLAIGHGQTISQPYIVALMTDLLDLQGGETVLEIGTGSGYQAAVLAEIAATVHTVEFVADLSRAAQAALARAGYRNIRFRVGDGRLGWPEAAPYTAIMVTAAAETVPDSLVAQLAPGGRMVLPVGKTNGPQNLILVRRDETGRIARDTILSVAFVPLVGGN
jgi:protein-L-isoaspartate(D-aspartate) O-methyltransferase